MFSTNGLSSKGSSTSAKRSSSPKSGFSDWTPSSLSDLGKSRPNSAPLQNGGLNTYPTSVGNVSGVPSAGSASGSSMPTDTMSLVEQRLRIVKRNRSKSSDEGASANATLSGLSTATPKVAAYPVQDVTPMTKSDRTLIEGLTRDVLDAFFFPDVSPM